MTQIMFKAITFWQEITFPTATAQSKICHLKQEVDELHTAVCLDTIGKELEFADCFILLFGAAASYGMSYIDIINAIDKKMKINLERKWGSADANGVINHIEP